MDKRSISIFRKEIKRLKDEIDNIGSSQVLILNSEDWKEVKDRIKDIKGTVDITFKDGRKERINDKTLIIALKAKQREFIEKQ